MAPEPGGHGVPNARRVAAPCARLETAPRGSASRRRGVIRLHSFGETRLAVLPPPLQRGKTARDADEYATSRKSI